MIIATILGFMLLQDTSLVFSGRAGDTRVVVPRFEAAVTIDGRLDEPVWQRAARLTDFSQYQPVDGRPAEDPTEVLVWYSADAIHFGIRAYEIHGDVVRATRANRDNIGSEDHVQILLDTDGDGRSAFLFGVNALGIQQDGIRSASFGAAAGGRSATGGGFSEINPLEGNVDLNPDYAFDSRGRLVDGGYEVEIRIPFKSLRYPSGDVQAWGIHILRRVQHSGFQDTWAPAVRANANFLAQGGRLEGLRDLRRGLVLDVTPTVTARLDGNGNGTDRWSYGGHTELGADIRWGPRQDLTVSGTVNPDFSQVEADVGQVLLNERFALFYPEKRPFFLEALELFETPNQLIYTRRIVAPRGGAKLAGRVGGTTLAAMALADDRTHSWSSDHLPLFGVVRARGDVAAGATVGGVATTREDGGDYSRLLGADLRVYHSRLYYIELQAVQSWTDSAGAYRSGSLLQAVWDRTGRQWGFHYRVSATAPGFDAAAGFVNRTGVIDGSAFNRISFYGAPDALVQTYGTFIGLERLWDHSFLGDAPLEGSEFLWPSATLRGGWQVGGSLSRSFFSYDPSLYDGYTVERTSSGETETVDFTVPDPERNLMGGSLRVTTPTHRYLSASVSYGLSEVPIFSEAAPGRSVRIDALLDIRPTAGLRGSVQFSRLRLTRQADGSEFSTETIPRLKVEYQLNRAIFLRVVSEYAARSRAPLEDREGNPILIGGVHDAGSTLNELRMDWLFSYRPVPGTLVYVGYGSTLEEPDGFRFNQLRREVDGFFIKASYLLRL